MILWAVLMAVLFIAFIGGIFYLIGRLRKFQWMRKAAGGKKKLEILLGAVIVIIPAAIVWVAWGQMNAIICILHLIVFWMVSEAIFALITKIRKKTFAKGGSFFRFTYRNDISWRRFCGTYEDH